MYIKDLEYSQSVVLKWCMFFCLLGADWDLPQQLRWLSEHGEWFPGVCHSDPG